MFNCHHSSSWSTFFSRCRTWRCCPWTSIIDCTVVEVHLILLFLKGRFVFHFVNIIRIYYTEHSLLWIINNNACYFFEILYVNAQLMFSFFVWRISRALCLTFVVIHFLYNFSELIQNFQFERKMESVLQKY